MTHQDPHYTKSSLSTLPIQIVSKTATDEVNNDEKCLLFSHLSTSSKQSSSQLTKYPNTKPVLQAPNIFANYASDPSKGTKLQYDQLEDRLKKFLLPLSWEGPLDTQLMAEAGFVHTGQEDLVYCFSCNIKLDGWTKHMDPLLRHKEESPTCSFVRKQLQVITEEKKKATLVVAPSKPLNPWQTAGIRQLQSQASTLVTNKSIHTVLTGLDEP